MTTGGRSARVVVRDGALDLVCVAAFVLIGRRSHQESSGLEGFVRIAWPFAVGLLIATAVAAWTRLRPWRSAVVVWLGTVGLGMVLRIGVQDRPFKVGFVIVTTLFLAVTMLGWRALVWAVWPRVRRRTR